MAELENISQIDDDKAIQASIQESLKELMGDQAPADSPQDAAQEVAPETAPEQTLEAAPEPAIEEAPAQEAVFEAIEEPSQEPVSEEAADDSAQDSNAELTQEDLTQELAQESIETLAQELTQDDLGEEIADIQFEEVLDLDSIQQKLLERIYEDDPEINPEIQTSQDVDAIVDKQAALIEEKRARLPVKYNSITSKKYVIYINSENIDFIENLSIDERKDIINKILKEQNEVSIKTKELNKKAKYLKHALVACLTFIIGFPMMFVIVNKSIESSMTNYQQAKQNVAKLYKQGGKVKMTEQQ